MKLKSKTLEKSGWTLEIDTSPIKIGEFRGWRVFADLFTITQRNAYGTVYDHTRILVASRAGERDIKASSLLEMQRKIEKRTMSTDKLRKACKALTTDQRKCEFCELRFMCLTEK